MHSELRSVPGTHRLTPPPAAATSIVVFTTIDGALRQSATGSCEGARLALDVLATRGVPIVLMSNGDAASVEHCQRELGLAQPFICEGGSTLYIPRGYFEELDGLTSGDDAWETFHFGVADPARAVRLLSSLFNVRGEDILTIGFGSGWTDRLLLAAVDVPIIVRDEEHDQRRLFQRFPAAYVTTASGPAGWSEAVLGAGAV
jgi:predicted mannosyl-3-phosphoglycerate phosphatase (HAD superfamily)